MSIQYTHAEAQPRFNSEKRVKHEWAVLLDNGETFYTGGFDDLFEYLSTSLSKPKNQSIAGTFNPATDSYYETQIHREKITAIVDLRGRSE